MHGYFIMPYHGNVANLFADYNDAATLMNVGYKYYYSNYTINVS